MVPKTLVIAIFVQIFIEGIEGLFGNNNWEKKNQVPQEMIVLNFQQKYLRMICL